MEYRGVPQHLCRYRSADRGKRFGFNRQADFASRFLMKSVEILRTEHRRIRLLLDALQALITDTESSGRIQEERANELMKLFELFADGIHQDKEEQHFFPKLLQRATPEKAEQIEVLLHDHKGERQRMMSMASHLTSAMFGEPISVREFLRDAKEYLRFHGDHMTHEGVLVFPLAESLLTDEDDLEIVGGFESIDREGPGHLEERITATCRALGVVESEDSQRAPNETTT